MISTLPEHHHDTLQGFVSRLEPDAVIITAKNVGPARPLVENIIRSALFHIDGMRKQVGLRGNIYVCAVGSMSFQAVAAKLGDDYCILLWTGAFTRTATILTRLLRTRFIANWLGIELPAYYMADKPLAPDTFDAYRRLGEMSPYPTAPSDPPALLELEYEAARVAAQWLVLHEVGHIAHGHLSVARKRGGVRAIVEYETGGANLEALIDAHTLEMDADAFASQRVIEYLLNAPSVLDETLSVTTPTQKILARLKLLTVAAFAMMRGFDSGKVIETDLFSTDHPHAWIRLNMMGSVLCSPVVARRTGITPDMAEEITLGMIEMERAVYEATGVNGYGGNIPVVQASLDQRYLERLLARWAKLRPALSEAKLCVPELAAAQADPM